MTSVVVVWIRPKHTAGHWSRDQDAFDQRPWQSCPHIQRAPLSPLATLIYVSSAVSCPATPWTTSSSASSPHNGPPRCIYLLPHHYIRLRRVCCQLVALSYLISWLGAYTSTQIMIHAKYTHNNGFKWVWTFFASIAFGFCAIWSMHFGEFRFPEYWCCRGTKCSLSRLVCMIVHDQWKPCHDAAFLLCPF